MTPSIHQIWKHSDEVYGAPRINAELTDRYHIALNRKTVRAAPKRTEGEAVQTGLSDSRQTHGRSPSFRLKTGQQPNGRGLPQPLR
ncbi:IS3 family transposase [Corynebacterium sp. HMSC04H06]|uniref:IS3 family transposase n=1 Tax=Corynebacterium sp. HMSC04H06 TaxID=1581050 RepID=UPI0009F51ABD